MHKICKQAFGREWTCFIGLAICLFASGLQSRAQNMPDSLKSGFQNPPQSALPRVWWHWMGGNITKDGIKLDLDWMHRAGIGGFQAFEGTMLTPKVVDPQVPYMSKGWKDAFKYAIDIGNQYGMEMSVASSPGWSETGGPWVRPENAMKKIVWSETRLQGGRVFRGKLPRPPATVGPFQNLPATLSAMSFNPTFPEFYADSEVIAYRAPADDVSLDSLHPKITASSGQIDSPLLYDGDLVKSFSLPAAPIGKSSWIQYEFDRPQTIQAVSLAMMPAKAIGDRPPVMPILEASDDGSTFRNICVIESLRHGYATRGNINQTTVAFLPVTSRFFRVSWTTPAPAAGIRAENEYKIAELVLSPGARVNHFEEKVGFATAQDLMDMATPVEAPGSAIAKEQIVRLTGRMQPDGTLEWTPPPGSDWVVLRFGYSLTGAKDAPAPQEATGLEVDKLDHVAVKQYLEHYLEFFNDTIGPARGQHRGLKFIVNDSWEAGNQTWTNDMVAQFIRLRGYDPRPWMPVLAGRVVESSEASDRFLWDFRKTIGDLIVKEHYGQIDATLREHGLGRYSESHEDFRAFLADGMEVKKNSQVSMGAMWTQKPGVYGTEPHFDADDRESASVAHIYGQNIAAAESLTSCDTSTAWAWSPATLKPTADQEFLNGINRIVIHESALQPFVNKAPGMTLGPCGQWFNRNETWAEQAKAWTTYLARNSFLLQQGRFVGDILYFYGEDTNITARFANSAPEIPAGYDFDYINSDGIIHELFVSNGIISTRSGMSYRVLILDGQSKYISLSTLRALGKLVEQGAIIAGPKPTGTPSLADDENEFKRLDDELFGSGAGVHSFGKGKVYAGRSTASVLRALNIAPDFDYIGSSSATAIRFIHRRLKNGDVYFVNNRSERESSINASFRVAGATPELWHSETGKIEPASFTIANGRTSVPLKLEPWGSIFVVFRTPTKQISHILPDETETVLATLNGPWNVAFQHDRGAPPSITLNKLISWTDASDSGVKYFSGTGTYTKTVTASPDWFKHRGTLWLDLGQVGNLADVTVNGREIGITWHSPFRVNLSSTLRPGENQIQISVTNAWVNRLIGDHQPDAKIKYTFTTWPAYTKDSPLQTSGLLGPVRIIRTAGQVY